MRHYTNANSKHGLFENLSQFLCNFLCNYTPIQSQSDHDCAQPAIYWCFLWPLTTVLRVNDHWTQLLITDSLRYFARRNDNRGCVYRPTDTYWMTCFTSAKNTKLWPFSSAVTTAKQDSLLQDCILEIISLSYKKSYPPMVKKEATPIKQFVNQQR